MLGIVARAARIVLCLTMFTACDSSSSDRGTSDGDCPRGWSQETLYTEPGCDPAPESKLVCVPDSWDAGCVVICGCDGEMRCADIWGKPGEWAIGAPHPFTNSCEDEPSAPTSSQDDSMTSMVDASDSGRSSSDGDPLDSGTGDSGFADGGPRDATHFDASRVECDEDWRLQEVYTEPGCVNVTPTWVCVPNLWDGGCLVTCGCDGLEYCGEVFGRSGDWSFGATVPYTECPD